MNHNFCNGCPPSAGLPKCAIGLAPNNAYIEDIINGSPLFFMENFICHKTAQNIVEGKLKILDQCNDCGLCYITCPYIESDYTTLFSDKLEKVIFNDFGKASILFQVLFPNTVVATQVQVKGNFRTKRIDLVIKKGNEIYFIKLLKTIDKISFYTRSYLEVIQQYKNLFPSYTFKNVCLVNTTRWDSIISVENNVLNLSNLYSLIGGK